MPSNTPTRSIQQESSSRARPSCTDRALPQMAPPGTTSQRVAVVRSWAHDFTRLFRSPAGRYHEYGEFQGGMGLVWLLLGLPLLAVFVAQLAGVAAPCSGPSSCRWACCSRCSRIVGGADSRIVLLAPALVALVVVLERVTSRLLRINHPVLDPGVRRDRRLVQLGPGDRVGPRLQPPRDRQPGWTLPGRADPRPALPAQLHVGSTTSSRTPGSPPPSPSISTSGSARTVRTSHSSTASTAATSSTASSA